jgi:hypothetical protein
LKFILNNIYYSIKMIAIYSSWTQKEHDEFYDREWPIGDWDWWDDFISSTFKQGWGYEELIASLNEDFKNSLSLDDIKEKYLK